MRRVVAAGRFGFFSSSEARRTFARIKMQSDIDHLSQFGVNSFENGGFKGSSHICPLCLPFPPLAAASTPPPPPSYGDSCLSLINAWHLARREREDVCVCGGGGGESLPSGCGPLVETVKKQKKRQPGLKKWEVFWQRPPPKKKEEREGEDEVSW